MLKWYAPMATPYDLMMRVSHHYYRSHLSMAEIGNRLGISRHRVGRLLKAAVATGMVNIEKFARQLAKTLISGKRSKRRSSSKRP